MPLLGVRLTPCPVGFFGLTRRVDPWPSEHPGGFDGLPTQVGGTDVNNSGTLDDATSDQVASIGYRDIHIQISLSDICVYIICIYM